MLCCFFCFLLTMVTASIMTSSGKEDIIISDQLNHASIIDAVRVAGVQNKFAYKHSDMADLETQLVAASKINVLRSIAF